jgi:TATA-box binding protein (TBP) (component of TFIID and TFIIIB)
MSWNVSGIGKVPALAAKIDAQFEQIAHYGMIQEELDIAMAARSIIAASLAANDYKGLVVRVEASGSMASHPADGKNNNLTISIQQVWGFVE